MLGSVNLKLQREQRWKLVPPEIPKWTLGDESQFMFQPNTQNGHLKRSLFHQFSQEFNMDLSKVENQIVVKRLSEGVSTIVLQREPVNMLGLDQWTRLLTCLTQVENDKQAKAVIIQSGLQRDVYSAGHDLAELYAPSTSKERYAQFWKAVNTCLTRLYQSPLITISAIRGACPAGGCCIAMCCDHRIMSLNGFIGLNEVQLGIPVPKYWYMLMARLIGQRQADRLCLSSTMVQPQEALELKLIDQLVEKGELEARAIAIAQLELSLPQGGRIQTKMLNRQQFCEAWLDFSVNTEAAFAWGFLAQPATVKVLESVMQGLKSKKRSKL